MIPGRFARLIALGICVALLASAGSPSFAAVCGPDPMRTEQPIAGTTAPSCHEPAARPSSESADCIATMEAAPCCCIAGVPGSMPMDRPVGAPATPPQPASGLHVVRSMDGLTGSASVVQCETSASSGEIPRPPIFIAHHSLLI